VGFEPTRDPRAPNGFRDRSRSAKSPANSGVAESVRPSVRQYFGPTDLALLLLAHRSTATLEIRSFARPTRACLRHRCVRPAGKVAP